MEKVQVHLLGTPYVEIDGVPINFPYKKMEAIFYYLCVKKNSTRQEIVQMFWPDTNETAGRKSLREALYQIKKMFGPDCLETNDRTHLSFRPDFPLFVDWDHVTADTILDYGDTGILSHFHVKNTYEFEEWTTQLQEEYNHMYIQAVQQRLYQADAQKNMDQIKQYSKILFKKDPYNEDFYYEAMDICAVNGNYTHALRIYQEMEEIFQRDLGITPSEETSALYERILNVKGNMHSPNKEKSHFFYGRTEEIYRISECISDFSQQPPSPCIMFYGEAGCGKTHLLEHSMNIASGFSCISLHAACEKDNRPSGNDPWKDILQQMLSHGITLPADESHIEDLSYWKLRNILLMSFEKLTAKSPVVLFIDDIQWMDLSGLRLLNKILQSFGMQKVRLVCTCLTNHESDVLEALDPLSKKGWLQVHSLMNSSKEETLELISRIMPQLNYDMERRSSIYTLTEGNIGFLLEIIKTIQFFS